MSSPLRFCLLTFSCFILLLRTARAGDITGFVTNADGRPVAYASVLLLHIADSSLAKTELTGEKGEYRLTPVAAGNYVLKVMAMGYTTHTSSTITVANNDVALPVIALQAQAGTQLGEVAVRGQKPLIEVQAGKLVVNVENSIVSAGSSVLDVLARSPGITVDNNDNISLKGKQGVNVLINGKVQPMAAQDLANMLKSMPAGTVATIELISNPSARYDAAGTAGIINIKLKKDSRTGLNGTINGTYAQGVYGKGNAGFNMNYRHKRFNLFANYNHSLREGFNRLTLVRKFYSNGSFAGAYDQDNNYLYHIATHLGGLGMDYKLTSKTVIGMALTGETTDFRRDGFNYSRIIDSASEQEVAHFTTANTSPNIWSNYTANVNLRHNFDSAGRNLAVDADYATYPSNGTQQYTTHYYDSVGSMQGLAQVLHGDLQGITQIRSVNADYTHPLGDKGKIEAGLKASYVTADNDLKFANLVGVLFVPDPGKTYHFIYTEHINAAYVSYSCDWPKWSTQLGLRGEQTLIKGDDRTSDSAFTRSYIQPFPSFAVQRHISAQHDLGITLSRRIERPNYEQLNPFKYYLDPTTYKAGYPYLNPALSYSAELSYVYKQRFITSLNYTLTSAPITEVVQPSPTEDKVTIQTTKNLTSMAYYGINGSYQFTFAKWWTNTTNANVYYAHYTGDIAGTNLNAGKATFDVNTSNSFLLPANWSAELSAFYQAPQVYGYMTLKPTWMLNMGLQKNLFNKKATARLNVTDIFWRGYPRAVSNYSNYYESFVARRDTRQVSISFTYRLGKRTLQPAQRHSGGAEDEKRRAGKGS